MANVPRGGTRRIASASTVDDDGDPRRRGMTMTRPVVDTRLWVVAVDHLPGLGIEPTHIDSGSSSTTTSPRASREQEAQAHRQSPGSMRISPATAEASSQPGTEGDVDSVARA
jgi:hypothetical protein